MAVVALALVPAAHAQGIISAAADSLRTDPVYVSPDAEEQIDAQRVRDEIASSRSGPVYVAVLPAIAMD